MFIWLTPFSCRRYISRSYVSEFERNLNLVRQMKVAKAAGNLEEYAMAREALVYYLAPKMNHRKDSGDHSVEITGSAAPSRKTFFFLNPFFCCFGCGDCNDSDDEE